MRSVTAYALCATIMGSVVAIAPASAQTAAAPDADAFGSLTEIVVTATKRVESIQTVPISIAVVSQAQLQEQNVLDTADLGRVTPSVAFNQVFIAAGNAFSVRGVGSLAGGAAVDQSVGVAFDGVPLGSAAGNISDLVDMQRVEVLKGPQGMLFGKNASAGLINLVSTMPNIGKTEVIGRASYGTLNDQQYEATANLPLGDTTAVRVSGWKFKHDGTVLERKTGQRMNDKNTAGARLRLRWLPVENLDFNFTAEFQNHVQNGTAYTVRSYGPAVGLANGPTVAAYEQSRGIFASPTNRTADDPGNSEPFFDRGNTSAWTFQGDYTIPSGGIVTSVLSYRANNLAQNGAAYPVSYAFPYQGSQTVNKDVGHYRQLTAELRYASPLTDRLHYVAGLFFFKEKLTDGFTLGAANVLGNFLPLDVLNYGVQRGDNKSSAAFGEATFDITPQLHFIAGARESHDDDAGNIHRIQLTPTPPYGALFGLSGPGDAFGTLDYNARITDTLTSWRTGLQYQMTPDAMVYLTASHGYKGPGVALNIFTASTDPGFAATKGVVKPEVATAYEMGVKTQWFERRVTVNVAAFDETFTNFQATQRSTGSANGVLVTNAPRMKSDGVDFDANFVVTNEFNISAAMTYANSRFTEFSTARCYGTQTVGCVNNTQVLSGVSLNNAPKVSANVNARYDAPLTADLRYFFDVNDAYKSKEHFETANSPYEVQPAYNIVNASVGVRAASGHWGVTGSVDNLANTHYVNSMLDQGGVFIGQIIGYDTLRTYHVALDVRF
ncbi:MAG: TonB-dependent receptor [Pseudomonadota bacterium]|nr:TonB-dependent receptor [Pseudomonadota bacterium]